MMKNTVRDEREGTKDETQVFLLVAFILSVFLSVFPLRISCQYFIHQVLSVDCYKGIYPSRGQAGLGWAGRYIVKTLGLIVKRTWGIHHAQNLIKPVGNADFGAPFSKIALKMIKTLPREGLRNAFSERRETL